MEDVSGGTFTSVHGSRGALFDTPIVNPPQAAILHCAIVKRVAPTIDASGTEGVAFRSMAYIFLSYDHQIIDGADAARFLTDIRGTIESGDFREELGA